MNLLLKSKGFTMIEVLVALVILSVSLLALAGLMAMTTKNTSFGGHITEAATFAQDKLEELRVTPWAGVANGNDLRTGSTGINYTRIWVVIPLGAGNLRRVTITLNWTDQIAHSLSFDSVIAQ